MTIAITMGDPAGIGPEICLKTLAEQDLDEPSFIIGDIDHLQALSGQHLPELKLVEISSPDDCERLQTGSIAVLSCGNPLPLPVKIGELHAEYGAAAFSYIRQAIELALAGQISAIVTAPIHKESLSMAGVKYPGHTEMLADLGGAERVAMMLANDELRTVLVTIHCSLRDVLDGVTFDSVLETIRLADLGARQYGIEQPRIAVAGLNPHAGEGGLFGREEIEIITPAIEAARLEGLNVAGPLAGDTVFMQARNGKYDIVVAQYHDQGLIPVKYLGLEQGVNVTLGLPFIRTSPDHGTAFDIAHEWVADHHSLKTACNQAIRMMRAQSNLDQSMGAQGGG